MRKVVIAGRYRLIELVGRGGMGQVWLARDEELEREVAVKQVLPPNWLAENERDELRARTLREARTAARLNHPNVVRVYDVVRVQGDPWLIMEYVPSRSLQEIIEADGPLPPRRAAEIGRAVHAALRAAHLAGVLHRDVKPANVLLARDGRVLLTDFGLAVFEGGDGAMTRPGLVLGSPQYVAPERAAEGVSSVEADLWSLGATLHAAVEGRSPYARSTAMATLAALASQPPDPAPHAGPLMPVLVGLLRRDPRNRLGHDDIARLLASAATPAADVPAADAPDRPASDTAGAGRPGRNAPPRHAAGSSVVSMSGDDPPVPRPTPTVPPLSGSHIAVPPVPRSASTVAPPSGHSIAVPPVPRPGPGDPPATRLGPGDPPGGGPDAPPRSATGRAVVSGGGSGGRAGHPTPGDPARPGQADRPGFADRPGQADRPGFADRPGPADRGGLTDRPNRAGRPGRAGRHGWDDWDGTRGWDGTDRTDGWDGGDDTGGGNGGDATGGTAGPGAADRPIVGYPDMMPPAAAARAWSRAARRSEWARPAEDDPTPPADPAEEHHPDEPDQSEHAPVRGGPDRPVGVFGPTVLTSFVDPGSPTGPEGPAPRADAVSPVHLPGSGGAPAASPPPVTANSPVDSGSLRGATGSGALHDDPARGGAAHGVPHRSGTAHGGAAHGLRPPHGDGRGEAAHDGATGDPPADATDDERRRAALRRWGLASTVALLALAAGVGTALAVDSDPPRTGDGHGTAIGQPWDRPPGPPPGVPPPPFPCIRPDVAGTPVQKGPPPADPAVTVPADWIWPADTGGFHIALPAGWLQLRSGDTTCFQDPATRRILGVEPYPGGDPVGRLKSAERDLRYAGRLPAYDKVRLAAAGGGAEWECRWTAPNGERMHALRVLPGEESGWTLGWTTSDADWAAADGQFALIRDSIRPIRPTRTAG
ncbi:protein kinase [Micromonospora sp. WMMD975]|uniref:serine/threonine-protein kinase n=1 Tax=Micromonospora sp. WMMD975 TaxID=3016087 RepID=UPI00249C5352|nr:protein kinase [Micromonospora sp. WMMD975]WFE31026.1 protein kinase [Micromonospora sp. WMMD975]